MVDSFKYLVSASIEEAKRAIVRFPQPNYVISKFAEESGEVVKAAIHCAEGREEINNVRKEMIQVIAMLYRLWVEGDQVHKLEPVSGEPSNNNIHSITHTEELLNELRALSNSSNPSPWTCTLAEKAVDKIELLMYKLHTKDTDNEH